MITVKNSDVVNSATALKVVLNKEIDIDVSFEISLITKELQNVIDSYNESFKKIQNKYAEKDDDGNFIMEKDKKDIIKFTPENKILLDAEIEKLQNIEVEINVNKLKINRLKGIKLSPHVIGSIMYILDK